MLLCMVKLKFDDVFVVFVCMDVMSVMNLCVLCKEDDVIECIVVYLKYVVLYGFDVDV